MATAPNAHVFLTRLAHYENTPPLFYLLIAPLPLDHEVWLRLPSIIAGTALGALPDRPEAARHPVALLAALGAAVATFAVSYSDYSRGFMLASLGILLALYAATRLATGSSRRWWWMYFLGGTLALYSEYYTGLYLIAILGGLLALGKPRGAM